eukprot:scaffold50030_cov59-Phaeocystis_antarctica.AAC.2
MHTATRAHLWRRQACSIRLCRIELVVRVELPLARLASSEGRQSAVSETPSGSPPSSPILRTTDYWLLASEPPPSVSESAVRKEDSEPGRRASAARHPPARLRTSEARAQRNAYANAAQRTARGGGGGDALARGLRALPVPTSDQRQSPSCNSTSLSSSEIASMPANLERSSVARASCRVELPARGPVMCRPKEASFSA